MLKILYNEIKDRGVEFVNAKKKGILLRYTFPIISKGQLDGFLNSSNSLHLNINLVIKVTFVKLTKT